MPVLPVFDLGDIEPDELAVLTSGQLKKFVLILPVPSIGSSNSHIDVADDLLEISWVAESIAAVSTSVTAREDRDSTRFRTRYLLTVDGPVAGFSDVIRKCATLLHGVDGEWEGQFGYQYSDVRDDVMDYEDEVAELPCRVPEILEEYYGNLVCGAYYELRTEAPEWYASSVAKHPERRVGFWKSAYSTRMGVPCYSSTESLLIPAEADPDALFECTGQQYRLGRLMDGQVLLIANASYIVAGDLVLHFPMSQYFKSRVCASFAALEDGESWPSEAFDWSDASFTRSPYGEMQMESRPATMRLPNPGDATCLVDPDGSLIIVNDGQFFHILYDTKSLSPAEVKRLYSVFSDAADVIGGCLKEAPDLACDWSALDDEQFEQLCYDIVLTHARFDPDTIRKFGKSRSRDGGRDIEIFDLPRPGQNRRKWIFQCKLVKGNGSLSAQKVQDIGDMLDHHDVGGYGVITSAPIDATLYDKLDKVCDRRGVEKLTLSRLELERALARSPVIRERYFGPR